jgi:hypothetical protein
MPGPTLRLYRLLTLASSVGAVLVSTIAWTQEQAVCRTRGWIENAVIRLGLCPYASKPFYDETIRCCELRHHCASGSVLPRRDPLVCVICATLLRYAVHDSASDEELIRSFFDEALRLLDAPADKLATTMLIIPRYTGSIDEFYELYEWLTDTLEDPEEEVLNNQVRLAWVVWNCCV